MSSSNLYTDNVLLEWETSISTMQTTSSCFVLPIFIGTGEYNFERLPKERPSIKSLGNGDWKLVCRKSAYSTVQDLQRLDHLEVKDSEQGWDDGIIDGIISALDVFKIRFDRMKIKRGLNDFTLVSNYLGFHDNQVGGFGVVESDREKIEKLKLMGSDGLWRCDSVRIFYVPVGVGGVVGKVASMLTVNTNWKDVLIEEQDPEVLKTLMECLNVDVVQRLKLDWQRKGFDETTISILERFTSYAKVLHSLAITKLKDGNKMEDVVPVLVRVMKNIKPLRLLDLGGNAFSEKAMGDLIQNLPSQVERLLLNQPSLLSGALQSLVEHLPKTGIKRLDLFNARKLTDEERDTLMTLVKSCPKLSFINFMDNVFPVETMTKLFVNLKESNSSVNGLILDWNNILDRNSNLNGESSVDQTVLDLETKGMKALADFLEETKSLEVFYANTCQLGKRHANIFVRGLAANRTLTKIDLFGNFFNTDSIEAILDVISSHPTIYIVDLGWQKAKDQRPLSEACLLKFLMDNKTVKKLGLSSLPLCFNGFDGLLFNSTLTHLCLDGVIIDVNSLVKLAGNITGSLSIQQVSLLNLEIKVSSSDNNEDGTAADDKDPDRGIKALIEAFKANLNLACIKYSSTRDNQELIKELSALVENRGSVIGDDAADELLRDKFGRIPLSGTSENGNSNYDDHDTDPMNDEDNEIRKIIVGLVPGESTPEPILKFADPPRPSKSILFKPSNPITDLANLKCTILRTSATLAEVNAELSKGREIEKAVRMIQSVEKDVVPSRAFVEVNWGLREKLGENGVYILGGVGEVRVAVGSSLEDMVVKELRLRLLGSVQPSIVSTNKVIGEDNVKPSEHRKVETAIVNYPEVQCVENYPDSQEVDGVYVVILSESILNGIERDIDALWNALTLWDHLMIHATRNEVAFLPTLNGEGGGVFNKFQTRLKDSLYLLQARRYRDSEPNPRQTVTHALDIITRLMRYQAPVLTELKQCGTIAGQVVRVLAEYMQKKEAWKKRVSEAMEAIRERLDDDDGDKSVCKVRRPLNSDELCEAFTCVLSVAAWKKIDMALWIQWLEGDVAVTSSQGGIMILESLHLNKRVVDFSMSYAYTHHLLDKNKQDMIISALGEMLTKVNLIACKLEGPMTSTVKPVTDALCGHRTLKTLELISTMGGGCDKQGFNDSDLVLIGAALGINETLEKLVLKGHKFTEAAIGEFAEGLTENKTIRSLTLSDCELDDDAIMLLSDAIFSNSTIEELDFSENPFGTEGMAALVGALKGKSKLRSLNISGIFAEQEGEEFGMMIAKLLRFNIGLLRFDLGGMESPGHGILKSAALDHVVEAIADSCLEEINLTGQILISDALTKLVSSLSKLPIKAVNVKSKRKSNYHLHSSTLTNIKGCSISSTDLVALIEKLNDKRDSITTLNVSENEINDSSVAAISNFIEQCTVLQSVNIRGNKLSVESMKLLKNAISKTQSVVVLTYDWTDDNERAIEANDELQRALGRNQILTTKAPTVSLWKEAVRQEKRELVKHLASLSTSKQFWEAKGEEIRAFAEGLGKQPWI
ncbi:hypothetical protein HDU76_005835 [Blyttiomyces sp. JEL0837]|nr:hypothetical protein HDU76_005835 [Blyttiomyces sp. JEL0837]